MVPTSDSIAVSKPASLKMAPPWDRVENVHSKFRGGVRHALSVVSPQKREIKVLEGCPAHGHTVRKCFKKRRACGEKGENDGFQPGHSVLEGKLQGG